MASLGEAVVEVGADTTGFQREFEKGIQGATRSASASFRQLGQGMTRAGRSLSLQLTAPIIGIGIAAVKTQAQFEQTMNVMQVNASATGVEMEKLSDLAIKLGADTVFSANEAADAMLELAKGGFKPAQIAGGGVQATMALAATESMNLADAATITSNAMNIFSLRAKDATQIADALAAGSAASTASVTSLAEGLGNVGAAATQAGLDLQDTVGVLAALDQEGLKGAEGGTALRSFLMRLVPTSKRARDAMDDLNISFVNSDGSIKSISAIAGVLQKRLGGLTAEQRKLALQTIFGTYASSAATILMKEGTKGIREFVIATKEQGIAQKLADARMKGTAGAIERMKGALETAALILGKALAPAVIVVAGVIGDLATKFGELPGPVQTFIVAGAALLAVIGPVLIVVGTLITAIGTIAGAFAVVSLPVLAVVALIAAFGAALVIAYKKSETFRAFLATAAGFIKNTLIPIFLETAAKVKESLQPVFDQLAETWKDDILPTIQKIIAKFREWQPAMQQIISVAVKVIGKMIEFSAMIAGKVLPVAIRFAGFLFSTLVPAVLNVIGVFIKVIGKVISFGVTLVNAGKKVVEFVTKVISKITGFKDAITGALSDIGRWLYDAGVKLIQGLIDGITNKIGDAVDAVKSGLGKIKGLLPGSPIKEGPLVSWNNGGAGKRLMGLLADGIRAESGAVASAMRAGIRPIEAPSRFVPVAAPAVNRGPQTVTNEGATLVQNFYGPTTSGDRLREIDWTLRYATGRPNEAIA